MLSCCFRLACLHASFDIWNGLNIRDGLNWYWSSNLVRYSTKMDEKIDNVVDALMKMDICL